MSIEMIEPVVVPDVFISGIGSVEDVGGGVLRFTFYTKETHRGIPRNMVVAKMIISREDLPKAIWTACHAAGMKFSGAVSHGITNVP